MQMKVTLQIGCLVALMGMGLAACERTPLAPTAKLNTEPATPVPTIAGTDPATHPASEPSEHPEEWVLPGSLQPMTTRLELEARFGKVNVREESYNGPEGGPSYPVLVVFPDVPSKRLELVLDAETPDANISELRISDPTTLWHAANGLRPGMTLAELVALNRAPISFYGLGWDYGGAVRDWHGGTLGKAVEARIFQRVSLAARDGVPDAKLPEGDRSFRSDDSSYATIGKDLVVGQLGISGPRTGKD